MTYHLRFNLLHDLHQSTKDYRTPPPITGLMFHYFPGTDNEPRIYILAVAAPHIFEFIR